MVGGLLSLFEIFDFWFVGLLYIAFYRVPGTGDYLLISKFLFLYLFVCSSRTKKLHDCIINLIKEDGMMEYWNV